MSIDGRFEPCFPGTVPNPAPGSCCEICVADMLASRSDRDTMVGASCCACGICDACI